MPKTEVKTIVPIPAWVEHMTQTGNLTDAAEAYMRVPLVYRATQIRCNSLLRVPYHIYQKANNENAEEVEVDWMYPNTPLDDILWLTQAALLLAGASFVVKLSNVYGAQKGLQWLNPSTMQVRYQDGVLSFAQSDAGKTWTQEQMIYTREFNLSDDVGFGVSAAQVAMQAARLNLNISTFADNFFSHGAMPITTVSVAGAMPPKEQERIQNFFRRAVSNVRNAFRVLAVGNDVKIQTTQNPISELATPELNDAARKDIARAFGLPVTMLDSDETYATASQHATTYLIDTVLPAAERIAAVLNQQLLEPLGFCLEFAPDEMQEFQEDEAARASSLSTLIDVLEKCAMWEEFEAATSMLGYEYGEETEAQLLKFFQAKERRRIDMQAQPQAAQQTQMQMDNAQGMSDMVDPNAESKAIERAQFRRYLKKGKDPQKFVFKHLDESEKKMLLQPDAVKSIGATSARFQNELMTLVSQAWNEGGKITRDMRALVMQYVEDSYFEGVLEAGGSPDQLSSNDYAIVAQLENEQLQYVDKFAQDVQDATGDSAQQDSIRRRIVLWAENIYRAGQRGWAQTMATRKQRIIWNTANDELVCPVCGPLNGKIVEAGKPFAPGIYNEPAHLKCRCTTTEYVEPKDY